MSAFSNRVSHVARSFAVSIALSAGALAPNVARAQPSDTLSLAVHDFHGTEVAPPILITLPEGMEESLAFTMPSLDVDFLEPPLLTISDRFHLDSYDVVFFSDTNPDGMLPRPGCILIPGEAMETFNPAIVTARSDGDIGGVPIPSDFVSVTLGSWSGGPGFVSTFEAAELPAGDAEFLTFSVPGMCFDIEEPLIETGGVPGIISDYVDVTEISGFMLSSDNPNYYHQFPPTPFVIIEKATNDQELFYGLTFSSDVVPEPASIVLLGTGLLSLRLCRRRTVRGSLAAG